MDIPWLPTVAYFLCFYILREFPTLHKKQITIFKFKLVRGARCEKSCVVSVKADGEGEREKVEQLLRDDFHLDLWKAKRKEGIYHVKS